MAKKMSVEEILAAARANKSGGAKPAAPADSESAAAAPPSETPAAPAPPTAAATPAAASAAPKSAAKPAGKMSMAEILAAARVGKAGGAAPAAAAPAPAPKPTAPAKPAAERPAAPAAAKAAPAALAAPKETASILAAARKSAKPGPMTKSEAAAKGLAAPPAPAKKKIEVPPMPPKPDYARPQPAAAAAAPAVQTRRGFMTAVSAAVGFAFGTSLAVGFSSLVITHLMWLLGLARFMFPNILIEPPTRFKVGFPDTYAPGQVETKFIPQFGIWLVRYEFEGQPMIYALKSVCTHLGCTPNWLEAEQKFKCPCHGSGFYKDGVNFEGPAPRPLERYAISLADDGQLLVDKSRTFQQELGQWKDPASFTPV
ncbi:MAG TPA: ubiquinol-cytochrome c reductase iron-sulfur subunit [Pirellulaceae bacterium]|nr:ubiquinol-cytochrome c reductase iron-sulfur subunit [Pirellulaceae bacterium]